MTQKLGKYTVVEKLGEGAMGAVYKAYDEVLDRYVAIKTMAEDIKWDPELKLRFYREARSAAGLHHPNIVTIHDLGEDGKITYIVMEVLQGQDLKAIIKSQAPVALEKKLSFIAQVADGLYHALLKGIIHRDIKPGNIHVSPAGNVKILDFGIARIPSSDLTRSGARLGTPIYMSPEQIRGGDYDERSDLFSTGIVFYELVTYHHPFRDKNIAKTLDNILFQTRLPFAEQFPEAPAGLWEIIQTCLAKEPDQRYGSMAELAKACRDLLVDLNLASQRTWKQIQAALPLWRQAKLEGQAAQARDAALQQLDASGRQAEIPDYCTLRRLLAAVPENLAAAPPATPPAVPIPVRDLPPIPVPAPRSEAPGPAQQTEAPKPSPSPPTPAQIRGREMLEAGKGKMRDGLLDEALEQLRGAMAALGPQEEVVQALVETRRCIEERKSARIQEILGAARKHLEAKEYAQALGKIDEALAADPESFPAAELRRKALAEQEAEQERRRRRTEGEAKKALGLGLIAEERFRDSLEPLEQAAELLGGDAEVQAALQRAREAVHAAELEQRVAAELAQARELLAAEAFDKARRHARFVLELSPDNPEAGQLLSELERIEGENRRRALLSDHLARCRDAVGRKDWDAAARHSQEALQLDPQNREARQALQEVERGREESRRAEQVRALLSRARNALRSQEFDEAAAGADEALRLEPQNRVATELLDQIKQGREAKRRSDAVDSLLRRGRDSLDREEFDEARSLGNQALAADSAHGGTREFLRQIDTARKEKKKNEELSALLSKGQQCFLRGELDEAERCAREMLALDPQSAKAGEILSRAAAERARRHQEEIGRYLSRARQALNGREFTQARQAAAELRNFDPENKDAGLLLREIDDAEKKAKQEAAAGLLDQGKEALGALNFADATRLAQEARALDPGNRAAKSLLKETARAERRQEKIRAKEAKQRERQQEIAAAPALPGEADLQDRTLILDDTKKRRPIPQYLLWSAPAVVVAALVLAAVLWLRPGSSPPGGEAEAPVDLPAVRAALAEKRYDEAIEALRRILAAAPENGEAAVLLADAERQKTEAAINSLLIEAQALKSQERLDESLAVIGRIFEIDPSNEAALAVQSEIEARQASTASMEDQTARVRQWLGRAAKMLAAGRLAEARAELDKISRLAPGTPELAGLRKRLDTETEELRRQEAEIAATAERQERIAEAARLANEQFARGRYDDVRAALDQWAALAPQAPEAQALRQRVAAALQSLRTYELALEQKQYDEALRVLSQLEKINPADPAIPEFRKRVDARRAAASATLSIFRLGPAATLLFDDKPVGEGGEVQSLTVPTGSHKITVRNSQGRQFEKILEFIDGQTVSFVYDSAGPLLRDFQESDRDRIAARDVREQVRSFQVEHRHTFGSCRGQLHISGINVVYEGSDKSHSFNLSFDQVTLEAREDRVEVETKDGRRRWNFKLPDASQVAQIQVLWERLLQLGK